MVNLSCDLCYKIDVKDNFDTISEQVFYDICVKFNSTYHKKLLSTDNRYVCTTCVSTLVMLNQHGPAVYLSKKCFKRPYNERPNNGNTNVKR